MKGYLKTYNSVKYFFPYLSRFWMRPLFAPNFRDWYSLFRDWTGINILEIVYTEFMPQGQTIKQSAHNEILRRFMRSIWEKTRELWETKSWLLHQDNAPAHNTLSIRKFLAKDDIAVLEQPSYSTDLSPYFFLLPKLKRVLKGTHFQDSTAIKRAVKVKLRASPEKKHPAGVHESMEEENEIVHLGSKRILWRGHIATLNLICNNIIIRTVLFLFKHTSYSNLLKKKTFVSSDFNAILTITKGNT